MDRQAQIFQTKGRIKPIEEELKGLQEEVKKLEGDVKKEKTDYMAKLNAELHMLKEELKMLRMNKTSSTAFEWIPHRGMNRQQARWFRKNKESIKWNTK